MIEIADVDARLREIEKALEIDDGSAHFIEDQLYRDIVAAVAGGAADAIAMARLALSTRRLDFSRACVDVSSA
jgi:hypothetical protein